jgi:hypothetical protein
MRARARKQPHAAAPAARLASLARPRLEAMLDAGREAANCMRVLAKEGGNVVSELLRDATSFYEWDH